MKIIVKVTVFVEAAKIRVSSRMKTLLWPPNAGLTVFGFRITEDVSQTRARHHWTHCLKLSMPFAHHIPGSQYSTAELQEEQVSSSLR